MEVKETIYSIYQENFFKAVKNLFTQTEILVKYILLSAVAGSGKTFSLVEALKFVPKTISIKFFAFNKSIAEELQKKVPSHVDTSTVHSFGMKAIRRYLGTVEDLKVTELKSWKFIERHMNDIGRQWEGQNQKFTYIFDMIRLIDMYRLNLCDFDNTKSVPEKVKDLILEYDVSFDLTYTQNFEPIWNQIKKYNESCLQRNRKTVELDFTDMIYLPVAYPQIGVKKFKLVFIDECQDLSKCQQAFIDRTIEQDGFGVYVGDPKQAIYGFAGADVNSWENLKQREKTIELPLSVCYRCAKNIVKKAQRVYNHIQPWEEQVDGIEKNGSVFDAEEGDIILCRNVRPLVKLWFHFVGDGKKCYIKGKELGKSLINLVSKVKDLPKAVGLEKLFEELAKLEDQLVEAGVGNPRRHKKFVKLEEDVRTILMISARYERLSDVAKVLEEIFNDEPKNGIQLMTIHKAKGLENERVFICRLDLIPSKYALTPKQKEQERNLLYVAFTRAKKELIIDKVWKEN